MHIYTHVRSCSCTNIRMTLQSPLARRDVILGRLAQGQSVVAAALALEFEVSEDAIRRDLRALAAEGRCRRVYGGALPLSKAMAPMAARMEEARDRKQALARKAASLVKPGQFVFVDSGSTNLALVSCLPEDFELTIATNSIDIAAAALRRSDLRLIMVGGDVNHNVGGCVDAQATLSLTKMNVDLGVVGACAVSPATGVSAYELSDATFKRTLLAASRKRVVIVTDEKLAARAPHRVAELKDIDTFVVEHDADADALDKFAAAGCEILIADRPA
jgi:DeoR/GlpR family transcriptional regulator of sugar metabolism